MNSKYDVVIVGAGLSGTIIARRYAEELNKKVLILERRDHIGGNVYDKNNKDGIRVQVYGPHIFHTNNDRVMEFLSRFSQFTDYKLRCRAVLGEITTNLPFNFHTIDQFYSPTDATKLKKKLYDTYGEKTTILDILMSKDEDIKKYGEMLFDLDYSKYTAKQWGLKPSEIDPTVLKRVPVLFSYYDGYFMDKYECLPTDGFTSLIKNIIDHPNIDITLNIDGLSELVVENNSVLYKGYKPIVIYTGPTDEFFDFEYGVLPYRSLNFDFVSYDLDSYQDVPTVFYPDSDIPYTRITEYTKLPYQNVGKKTVIAFEYPQSYDKNINEPYYPILTEDSILQYKKYQNRAKEIKNLYLCGRLADFKYYNMDAVVLRALEVFDHIIKEGKYE